MYLESKGLAETIREEEKRPTINEEWADWFDMDLEDKGVWVTARGHDVVADAGLPVIYNQSAVEALEDTYDKDQEKHNKRRDRQIEKRDKYDKKQGKARAISYRSVKKSLRPSISELKRPKAKFEALTEQYGKVNNTTNTILQKQLDTKWSCGTDFNAWLANWENIVTTHKENDYKVNDAELCNTLLECLPREELAIYLDNLENKLHKKIYPIDEFIQMIRTGVNKRILRAEAGELVYRTTASTPKTNRTTKTAKSPKSPYRKKETVICDHCSRVGHDEDKCWHKHLELRRTDKQPTRNLNNKR